MLFLSAYLFLLFLHATSTVFHQLLLLSTFPSRFFLFPNTLDFDMKKNLPIPIYIPILLTFCNKFACTVMLLNISLLYNMFFCD